MSRVRTWWRADNGSAAAEMTIVTPCLVLLLAFIAVVIHRGVDARLRLNAAAHQAARAASLERTTDAAVRTAQATATESLNTADAACRSVTVETDTGGLMPGGTVTVTTSCVIDIGDTLLLGLPGTTTLTATATEPVDTWRGTTEPNENTT